MDVEFFEEVLVVALCEFVNGDTFVRFHCVALVVFPALPEGSSVDFLEVKLGELINAGVQELVQIAATVVVVRAFTGSAFWYLSGAPPEHHLVCIVTLQVYVVPRHPVVYKLEKYP